MDFQAKYKLHKVKEKIQLLASISVLIFLNLLNVNVKELKIKRQV
jgi:hypothetical protein